MKRQAFHDAERDGLIERILGRGTFVASPPSQQPMVNQRMIAFVTSVACSIPDSSPA